MRIFEETLLPESQVDASIYCYDVMTRQSSARHLVLLSKRLRPLALKVQLQQIYLLSPSREEDAAYAPYRRGMDEPISSIQQFCSFLESSTFKAMDLITPIQVLVLHHQAADRPDLLHAISQIQPWIANHGSIQLQTSFSNLKELEVLFKGDKRVQTLTVAEYEADGGGEGDFKRIAASFKNTLASSFPCLKQLTLYGPSFKQAHDKMETLANLPASIEHLVFVISYNFPSNALYLCLQNKQWLPQLKRLSVTNTFDWTVVKGGGTKSAQVLIKEAAEERDIQWKGDEWGN